MSTAIVVVLGLIAAAFGYALRERFPPFCIGFAYLFATLIIVSLRLKRGRVYLHNAAFVFLALAAAEFFFRNDGRLLDRPATHYEGPYSASYYQRDKELGYSVRPGRRTVPAIKKFNDGRLIYSVSYTIDEFGQRATPNVISDKNAVFFFGCSFTFGEGVNDADSLPYLYSALSRRRTRNFALHGYGAHQMLRVLETDRPKLLGVPEAPSLVVYVAISEHIDRAAGRSTWDPYGPWYEVENDQPRYVGSFSDAPRPNWRARILGYSRIADRLVFPAQHRRDLERFTAIIRKSRDLVTNKYGASFLVLLWEIRVTPGEKEDVDWVVHRLAQDNINVIRLLPVIPGLSMPEYYIPIDGHPNGKAHKKVANVIYDWYNAHEQK